MFESPSRHSAWSSIAFSDPILAMAITSTLLQLFAIGIDLIPEKLNKRRTRILVAKMEDLITNNKWPTVVLDRNKIWDDTEIEWFTFQYHQNFSNRNGIHRNVRKLENLEHRRKKLLNNPDELLSFWETELTALNSSRSCPQITLADAEKLEATLQSVIAEKLLDLYVLVF